MDDFIFSLDIIKEKKEKRFKPAYLIKTYESYFSSIDKTYPTSIWEAFQYRKRFKTFFRKQNKLNDGIKTATKLANRSHLLFQKIDRKIKKNKDYTKLSNQLDEIINAIDLENQLFEKKEYEFDAIEFRKLISLRENMFAKIKMTSSAITNILTNSFFNIIIKIICFSISFLLAIFAGDKIEDEIKLINPIIAKLVPAVLFFIFIDKFIDWIEEQLLWNSVKRLHSNAKEIREMEIKLDFFNRNFGSN